MHYGVQPCSAYYGEKIATAQPQAYGQYWPYTICGYSADQYEQAFGLYDGIQTGTDGSGVTVAITDAYASPTMLSDADTWSTQNNLPAPDYTQITPKADKYNKEKAVRAAGLVRRRDARRRVGPRHGAGSPHRLRRRQELRRRIGHGLGQRPSTTTSPRW